MVNDMYVGENPSVKLSFRHHFAQVFFFQHLIIFTLNKDLRRYQFLASSSVTRDVYSGHHQFQKSRAFIAI
jgi:hypothetical protein